uniref:Putative secreted protein n=1 Tax=Rhipicephalus microplus TaxID=6941 RepID=A0A6G5A3W5_RHIMP
MLASTVGFCNTLELVLLLDRVAVGRTLGCIYQLISQALCNGFDVAEGTLTGTCAEQPDGLVHPAQWRHINGLTTHCASTPNACGVFTRSTVDNGIHYDLQWVLSSKKVNDLKRVLHDLHCKQLLAIVAAMHHHGVGQTLHNGALGLAKPLGCITTRGVGQVLGMLLLHCNVVSETDIADLHIT